MSLPTVGRRLFWLALCGLLGVSCAHAGARPEQTPAVAAFAPADYYPLAVGNQWVYEGSFLGRKERLTVSIDAYKDGFYLDNHGGKLRVDSRGLRDSQRYLLKAPLQEGAKWRSVPSAVSVEHYEIVRTGAAINVPAGQFQDCLVVKAVNRRDAQVELVNEVTFAPRVGIIRLSTYVVHTTRGKIPQTDMELVEFKPAPRQQIPGK